MEMLVQRCQQAIAVWMPVIRHLPERIQVHAETLEVAHTSLVKLARSEAFLTLYEVVKYARVTSLRAPATRASRNCRGQVRRGPRQRRSRARRVKRPGVPSPRRPGGSWPSCVWAEEHGGGHNLIGAAGAAFGDVDFPLWVAGIVYVILMSRQSGHRN